MNQTNERESAEIELAKNLRIIENVAKQKMSREAISRYGTLKTAHPEKAVSAISYIAQAVQAGEISEIITDEQFKELLRKMQ